MLGCLYIDLPQISFVQERKGNMHPPPSPPFYFFLVSVGRRKSTFCCLSLWHSCSLWVERKGNFSLSAYEGGTDCRCERWVGNSLRTCSPQGPAIQPNPFLGWHAGTPWPVPSYRSEPCHFLSLERQKWGSRLPGGPEEQRVSIGIRRR